MQYDGDVVSPQDFTALSCSWTVPVRGQKAGACHPVSWPGRVLWRSYLSTTCQPSSVLVSVTAAVRFSLSTTAVTLHL